MNTRQKTFEVVAKFRITGEIPDIVTVAHIQSKIQEKISRFGVNLHGEYYGDYDEEWEMHGCSEEPFVEVCGFDVEYVPRPFCEQCGMGYKDFGVQIGDGKTYWCLDCWVADHSMEFSDQQNILNEERNQAKAFYRKKLEVFELDEKTESFKGVKKRKVGKKAVKNEESHFANL